MERTSQSPNTSRRARNAAYQRAYRERQRQKEITRLRQHLQPQQAQQQEPQHTQQVPQEEQQQSQQQSQHLSPQQHDNHLSQLQQPNEQNIELQYEHYVHHLNAHKQFKLKMIDNDFGYACAVCDRLWFQNDLKAMPAGCENLINEHFDTFNFVNAKICPTCHSSLKKTKIPPLSTSNGFKYPTRPVHLPKLDIVTERLISPRLPFMQTRRLRHGMGQYGILGQIINVPVSINNMVRALPRNIDNDYAINVHIKNNFAEKEALPLIKFLFDVFHLTMNNKADIPTTNKNTTIDAVFSRSLTSIESMVYISYFSYHKPILTIAT